MKKTGWHSRIALAFVLAVVMLFGCLAVTAFATADEGNAAATEEYDTPWYTITYTEPKDGQRASLDVRIKTAYSKYLDIRREDLAELKDAVFSVAYNLALDTLFAEFGDEENAPVTLDENDVNIYRLETLIENQLTGENAKESIEAILNHEFDTVIQLVAQKYADEKGYSYSDIEEKVVDIITYYVPTIYADEPESIIEINSSVASTVGKIFDEIEDVKAEGGSIKLSLSDLKAIKTMLVNGDAVFADGYFRYDVIKQLIADLPRPSELKDYTDEQMVLNYSFDAEFVFGSVGFDFSIGFEGDCSEIRTVMRIIAEYIDVDYVNGKVVVDVRVPAKFGKLLIRAIDSERIPDSVKHKIFENLSSSPEDFEAFFANLTFDEIISILESVDFESVLTHDFVAQYVDLSGLSNEEIVNKIKQYEGYYNKAKDLALRAMNKIPDSYMQLTLFDFYEGNGRFFADKTATVNIENVLSKITPKYAALIASFIDGNGDGTITLSGSLSVEFANVNRVTYMLGNDVHIDGFLPAGADITYFANVKDYNGDIITAWVDENGTVYTEMPDHDIVLYAYGAFDVTESAGVDAVYDPAKTYTISVTPNYVTSGAAPTYTYEWFFNGTSLGVSDKGELTVSKVADSGTYYCVVTVVDGDVTKTAKSEDITVTIAKAVIDISGIAWNKIGTFVYAPGAVSGVELVGVPAGVSAAISGTATATNAGKYTVAYTLAYDSDNYTINGAAEGSTEYEIAKADPEYTVPSGLTAVYGSTLADVALGTGFTWQNAAASVGNVGNNKFLVDYTPADTENYNSVTGIEVTVSVTAKDITGAVVTLGPTLTYNGNEQTQGITSVTLGGEAITYTVSGNKGTNAGSYTLTVTGTGNYSGTVTVDFAIAKLDASNAVITLGPALTYNGNEQTQGIASVTVNGLAAEYDVSGNKATDAGDYTLTLTFKGNFEGTATASYTVAKKSITGATVSLGAALTYNGNEQTQEVTGVTVDGLTVTYTVSGNKGTNAGNYTLTVTANGNFEGTVTKDWSVAKATIDISGAKWDYDPINNPFVYNGNEFSVALKNLPANVSATYTNNAATDAGEYEASYTFVYDSANYELTGIAASNLIWEIEKASIDMSGVTFEDLTVTYDGKSHSIVITGTLPTGVTVTYEGNAQTEVGTYTVTAKFTASANYNPISDMTATLTIEEAPKPPCTDHVDENGDGKCDNCGEELPKPPCTDHVDANGDGKCDNCGEDLPKPPCTDHVDENGDNKCDNCGEELDNPDYPLVNDFAVKDENGNIIVSVDAIDGLPNGTELGANNKTDDYKDIDLSSILEDGKIGILGNAYDIVFSRNGTPMDITNGKFTVRLIIPEELRSKEHLIVIHIADDGEISVMEGSERDGDYMVFETTHFSVYAVIALDDAPESNLLWLIIMLIILVICAVIVLLIIFRRGDKDTDNGDDNQPEDDQPEDTVDEEPVEEEPVEEPIEEPVEEPVEEPAEEPVEEPAEEPVEEPAEEPAEEPTVVVAPVIIANDDDSIIVDGQVVYVRYRSSFTSRLIQAEPPVQDYYTIIKNHILSYKGIKTRTSWNYELFNKGRTQCVKLNVKGKAITLELPLDPKEYNINKYHFVDRSDKPKFAALPMLMKVRSERSLKYALELIDEVMNNLGLIQGEIPEIDYHMPYESNRELARRGLVKLILPAGVVITDETVVLSADVSNLIGEKPEKPAEEVVEEPVAEESEVNTVIMDETVVLDQIGDDDTIVVGGDTVLVRYRSSFTSRLIQASEELQDYYTAIKNKLLSYKGVKARSSWNYENFSKGRTLCARVNIKGKTLILNLALAPEGYNENKYHFQDMSGDPKLEKLPMLLKVRSARSLKYALELIEELMAKLEIPFAKEATESYRMPYESNRELARRGLVKLILPKGVKISDDTVLEEVDVDTLFDKTKAEDGTQTVAETPVAEEPVVEEPVVEEPVAITAEEADEMVTDEVAEESIVMISEARGGRMVEINIGEINDNFEDGDTVTIAELKAKRLISNKAGRVKILAGGQLNKKLTVVADRFSLQAVKMITVEGGTVKQYGK